MVLVPISSLPKSPALDQPVGNPQSQTWPLITVLDDSLRPSKSAYDEQEDQHDTNFAPHICRHCSRITVDMRQDSKDGKTHGSIGFTAADIASALKDNCALFSAFHNGSYLVRMTSGPDNPIWVERTLNQPAIISFHEIDSERLKLGYMMSNRLGEFVLYTVPGQNPHELFGSQPPPNILPNSQLSFTRARKFLDKCSANHARCRDFNLKHMPTRLLEVSTDPTVKASSSSPSFRVRLVTNPPPAPYVTLSYCWGGDQPGKTTKKNLSTYSRSIPFHVLPLTIIDALTVTYSVGLKYLWVDALCIIQDSGQDKMNEIANMHRIYRGSFLTIAAGVAGTSLDGFLRPRVHDRGYLLNVRVDSGHVKDGEIRQVIAIPVRSRRDREILPLYTRAWTFQEGQLSTRVLAYGNRGMVYRCLESRHTDGGHEQPIETLRSVDDAISASFKYLDPGNQSLREIKHPFAWGVILEAYTSRELTVGDDKLLAVMAIAEEYKRTNEGVVGEYLAGLWRGEMLFQLLWAAHKASDVKAKFKRPDKYRAPSWSWASLDGHFRMFLHQGVLDGRIGYKYACELLHAETTLMGDNPMGQVKGGFIRLRGRVKKVVWRRNGTGGYDDGYGWAYGESESKWVRLGEVSGDDRLSWYVDIPDEWPAKKDIVMSCIEVCTYEGPENLIQIAMVQLHNDRGGSPNMTQGRGILLVPVEGQPDTYQRVGTMGCKGYLKGDVCFEKKPYWFDEGQSVLREIVVI